MCLLHKERERLAKYVLDKFFAICQYFSCNYFDLLVFAYNGCACMKNVRFDVILVKGERSIMTRTAIEYCRMRKWKQKQALT